MADNKRSDATTITVEYRRPTGLPVQFISLMKVAQVDTDVFIDAAILDDEATLSATKAAKPEAVTVPAYVVARFGMSVISFARIKRDFDDIYSKMKANGTLQRFGLEPDQE